MQYTPPSAHLNVVPHANLCACSAISILHILKQYHILATTMVFIQDCYCRLSPTGPAIDKVTHIDEVSLIAASQNRNMTTLTTSRHQPPAYKPSSELLQLKSPAKVYRLPSDETSSTPGPEQGHWKPAQGQAQPPQPLHQYDGPRSHSSAAVEQKALGHSMAVDLEVAVSGKRSTFPHVKSTLIT